MSLQWYIGHTQRRTRALPLYWAHWLLSWCATQFPMNVKVGIELSIVYFSKILTIWWVSDHFPHYSNSILSSQWWVGHAQRLRRALPLYWGHGLLSRCTAKFPMNVKVGIELSIVYFTQILTILQFSDHLLPYRSRNLTSQWWWGMKSINRYLESNQRILLASISGGRVITYFIYFNFS